MNLSTAPKPKQKELPESADVVVIGGGSLGTSIAYHLAEQGVSTLLLERHSLTAGTTWHSAGMLWRLRPSYVTVEMHSYTRQKCIELEQETGFGTWHENGGLFVACNEERLNEYKRLKEIGDYYDIPSSMVTPEELTEIHPLLSNEGVVGALYSPTDGSIDPTGIVNAYARAAKTKGAVIKEQTGVSGFEKDIDGTITAVLTECGNRIATTTVVNAAGAWAADLAALAGVQPLPLVAMKHAFVLTESIEGMHGMLPNVRDHDLSIYLKTQGDAIALGGYERNPEFWPEVDPQFAFGLFDLDFDTFNQNLEGHLQRCPAAGEAGIRATVCGPEAFTPDHAPLVGPDPSLNGLWHCCGFNSMGMMMGGGMGNELAHWMVHGAPRKDLFSFDIARFHPDCTAERDWILRTSHESYAKTYAVVFPHDEHLAGRGVRRSALYKELLAQGCVFQSRHGFERPGWFHHDDSLIVSGRTQPQEYDWYGAYEEQGEISGLGLPAPKAASSLYADLVEGECTFGWRGSFDAVDSEVRAARTGVAIFDQSYFGKFLLEGPDATMAAEWLASAPIEGKADGTVVYTALCNAAGGVQADLTMTIDSPESIYIASGGATATQDARWISTVLREKQFDAQLTNLCSDLSILSVQGPYSQQLLQRMTAEDKDMQVLQELPFSNCAAVGFNLVDGSQIKVRTMRLTFVGELGYELHIPAECAAAVYRSLMAAGNALEVENPGVTVANAGYHCIDSLSAEKGYRHWHADLTNADTPAEAAIGFVASKKIKSGPEFLGRQALMHKQQQGLQRKLVCLTIDAQSESGEWRQPLNGNETIWRDGECVGLIRSTAYGHWIGKTIAYGYVDVQPGVPKITNKWLEAANYEIGSIGERLAATLHLKAPFDPTNDRIKGNYSERDLSNTTSIRRQTKLNSFATIIN